MYNLGQPVRVTTTVKDPTGALVTTATVACSVTAPDGTITAPAVTNNGDGTYRVDIPANQVGFWLYVFTATGTASGVDQGQFTVRPIGVRIISLGEAKKQLNKFTTATADDEELGDYIDMATILMENLVGVIIPRSVTELHGPPQMGDALFLRAGPVLSVTSIVETWSDGTTHPLISTDFIADVRLKKITRVSAGFVPFPWPYGLMNVQTVHMAGRTTPYPMNFRLAAAELVANLWRTTQQRGAPIRPGITGQGVDLVPVTYAVPRRVQEMLYGGRKAPLLGRSS